MIAILKALETIEDNPVMTVSILSDSMAAILVLNSMGNKKWNSRPDTIEEIATIVTSVGYQGSQITCSGSRLTKRYCGTKKQI